MILLLIVFNYNFTLKILILDFISLFTHYFCISNIIDIVAPMAHDDTIDVVAPVTPGGADFVVSSVIQLLVFCIFITLCWDISVIIIAPIAPNDAIDVVAPMA